MSKSILKNVFVVLFSLVFAVSAYAAPSVGYKSAASVIQTQTMPIRTDQNLKGTWIDTNSDNTKAIYINFKDDNVMSVGMVDEYGNSTALLGEYVLHYGGHEIDTEYKLAVENENAVPIVDSQGRGTILTHYIGFFDDNTCVFSMDGTTNAVILKRAVE